MEKRLVDFLTQLNTAKTADDAWSMLTSLLNDMGAEALLDASDDWFAGDDSIPASLDDLLGEDCGDRALPLHVAYQSSAESESLTEGDANVDASPLRLALLQRSIGTLTHGPLSKKSVFRTVSQADQQAIHIAVLYAHAVIQKLLREAQARAAPLTVREKECLLWLARGLSSDRIAERLQIARITVDTHIGSAKRKLGAATREQTLAKAILLGMIAP